MSWLALGFSPPPIALVPAARLVVDAGGGFSFFSIVDGVASSLQGSVSDQGGRWLFSPAEVAPLLPFPDGGSVQPARAKLVGTVQRAALRDCSFILADGGCPKTLVISGFEWPYFARE
ncbi:MAG: hypothetical protein ACXWLP_02875 [Myxococcaceae bacterium]